MSRRFESRLKCSLPVFLCATDDQWVEGVLSDLSSTYFRAEFPGPLAEQKRYRFRITLSTGKEIRGETRIEKNYGETAGGKSAYVFVIDPMPAEQEEQLTQWIERQRVILSDDRRTGQSESDYRKNRRGTDRTVRMVEYHRVVITGIGVISPNAIGRAAYWKAIQERTSGIREITSFDTEPFPVKIAGEIPADTIQSLIPRRKMGHMGRATLLGWAAANLALEDGEFDPKRENLDQIGVAMGTTLGTLGWVFDQYEKIGPKNYHGQHPYTVAAGSCNAVSGEITVEHGFRGPSFTFSQGCSSSAPAISHAMDAIRTGRVELMLAGGAEAPLNSAIFGTFMRSGMLAVGAPVWKGGGVIGREECQGSVLGEGACVLLLESYDHAQKRRAPVFAELVSSGFSSDGFHMVLPHPSGRGVSRAVRAALEDGRLKAGEIDLIMGHFPGIKTTYDIEMRALRREFGNRLSAIPIANVKPLIGYTQAVCSAFELAAACLAFQEPVNWITYGRSHPSVRARRALVNCIGFGGKNIALILRAPG